MSLLIGNRRYTGSKKALLEEIYTTVKPFCNKNTVFADLFAGTGVVAEFMMEKGINVIVNDFLYSNYIAYQAWLEKTKFSTTKIQKLISEFNKIQGKDLKGNYFSKIYGNKYFSNNDAKKIGYIREKIERLKITKREKNILLASLMYSTDKIANTVGHFEHFLSTKPKDKDVILKVPHIKDYKATSAIYNMDSNKLVRSISCDIAYIDPPYNARQYINFYHVLENLARWNKPTEFEGVSMKFKRDELKSDYSKSKASIVFKDLIDNLNAKLIVVSYNNTYSAKSSASNNKITEIELVNILSNKGKVTKKEIKHKSFNAGKTDFKDHKEFLYICKVK